MADLYKNKIYLWQGDDTQPYPNDFTYRSRIYLMPWIMTFTHFRVIAETEDREDYWDSILARDQIIARNKARISHLLTQGAIGEDPIGQIEVNGDSLETVPTVGDYSGDFNLSVKFYVDDALHCTKEVYHSNKPLTIDDGYKGREFYYEIIGNVTVKRFDMATSVAELMKQT